MSKILELQWMNLTDFVPSQVLETWWITLSSKLSENGRGTHNFQYLERKFDELSKFRDSLKNFTAFIVALFFQYLNYDPQNADFHVKNLRSFEEFAEEAGISKDSELCCDVRNLLSAASVYSTEEHKVEGAYGSEDIHYFLDLDMVALGREPDSYARYVKDVAEEYSFLHDACFRDLRKRILRSFLLIPNIFATKIFRDLYERQARANIQNELEELEVER